MALNIKHPNFPGQVWVVVEQPRHEPKRIEYLPRAKSFVRTENSSLIFERKFKGVYGWISGTGIPPGFHIDVLLITEKNLGPGDVIHGFICGVFLRNDGDHKFVAVDDEIIVDLQKQDIRFLSKEIKENLFQQYPHAAENEGWHGFATATKYLINHRPTHD